MALLQESGVFNGQSYLIRKDVDLGRDLKDFTVCAWISLNYLRGQNNHWISLGNSNNEEILKGGKKNLILYFRIYLEMLWMILFSCLVILA